MNQKSAEESKSSSSRSTTADSGSSSSRDAVELSQADLTTTAETDSVPCPWRTWSREELIGELEKYIERGKKKEKELLHWRDAVKETVRQKQKAEKT